MSFAPNSAVAQHVDRDRLYTDLSYRFSYVCAFANFGPSDIAALHSSAPILGPLVAGLVDAVYSKLFSFDVTKASFTARQEGFTGPVSASASSVDTLKQTDEQIKFRKSHLSAYLVKLVTAEYDNKFLLYLDHVGRIHTNTPEKKSKINVEYIHINALFAYVHSVLVEAIDGHVDLQSDSMRPTRVAVLSALTKLLWIQNDLFAKYYVKDGVHSSVGCCETYGHATQSGNGVACGSKKVNQAQMETGLAVVTGVLAAATAFAWCRKNKQ